MSNFIHGGRSKGFSGAYNSWRCMKRRCDDSKYEGYKNYGGRGIRYDPRWAKFEAFLNDMGERPPGYDLSRLDQDGNYTFSNCNWLPHLENRGKRRTYRNGSRKRKDVDN